MSKAWVPNIAVSQLCDIVTDSKPRVYIIYAHIIAYIIICICENRRVSSIATGAAGLDAHLAGHRGLDAMGRGPLEQSRGPRGAGVGQRGLLGRRSRLKIHSEMVGDS